MEYIRTWFVTMVLMLLCKTLLAQTSVVTITYGKKFIDAPVETDTISNTSVKAGINDFNRRMPEAIVDCEYTLNVSKNESICKAVEKMDIADGTGYKMALVALKGEGTYYINIDGNITIEHLELDGEPYAITQKLSDINWSLQNETKKIGKYTCYKATTAYDTQISYKKRKHFVEAWYVPELPIKHGPVGFGNLPGLILELNIDRVCFYMKSINLNPVNKIMIKRPDGKVVTQLEFDDLEDKMVERLLGN